MRNYHDFDENFKFLYRSQKDKEIKKAFDTEIVRALESFMHWYRNGDTPEISEYKTRRTYGTIISDMAMFHLSKQLR